MYLILIGVAIAYGLLSWQFGMPFRMFISLCLTAVGLYLVGLMGFSLVTDRGLTKAKKDGRTKTGLSMNFTGWTHIWTTTVIPLMGCSSLYLAYLIW